MAEPLQKKPEDTAPLERAIVLLKMLSDEQTEEVERKRATLELSELEQSNEGVTDDARESLQGEESSEDKQDEGTPDEANPEDPEEDAGDPNDEAPPEEEDGEKNEDDEVPDPKNETEEDAQDQEGAPEDEEKDEGDTNDDAEPVDGETPETEKETEEGAPTTDEPPGSERPDDESPTGASTSTRGPSSGYGTSDADESSDSKASTPAAPETPTPSEGTPAANASQPAKSDAAEAAPAPAEAPAPAAPAKEGAIANAEKSVEKVADKAAEKTEDPLMKILDKENVDRLADAVQATAAERKAVDDARKVAQGALAVGEIGLSGDVTPANVVKTYEGAKAAKKFIKDGEKEQLASFGEKLQGAMGDLPKLAFDAAKKLIVDAAKITAEGVFLGVIVPILIGLFALVLFITVIVQVLDLAKDADEAKLDPQQGEETAQEASPGVGGAAPGYAQATRGLVQSEPSLLLGLSTEMMLALNACGDVAPIIVTYGVGGPPGTARYEGRAVGLATQSVDRETVAALEACLATQGGRCVEELLGPDPDHCVTTGPDEACEERRRAHILRSNSEISFALKRGCETSASAALAESSPAP